MELRKKTGENFISKLTRTAWTFDIRSHKKPARPDDHSLGQQFIHYVKNSRLPKLLRKLDLRNIMDNQISAYDYKAKISLYILYSTLSVSNSGLIVNLVLLLKNQETKVLTGDPSKAGLEKVLSGGMETNFVRQIERKTNKLLDQELMALFGPCPQGEILSFVDKEITMIIAL
ncbi:hypothetical protein LOAG_07957 [Loa loa]|uniref:Uncharacterized protein n=1 Tax=Loa loa TaxID=7209 RepID=A0A1S0TUS7_LOALO|nr:hypothetical protein LOAG_07957 [Loa loa]EFO20531.1 hypothetical protein LOAG_07957 [Loa loa]